DVAPFQAQRSGEIGGEPQQQRRKGRSDFQPLGPDVEIPRLPPCTEGGKRAAGNYQPRGRSPGVCPGGVLMNTRFVGMRRAGFLVAAVGAAATVALLSAESRAARAPLPDLTIDAAHLQASAVVRTRVFKSTDCAVAEGCVGGVGKRKLLR